MSAGKRNYQAFYSIVVTTFLLMGGLLIPWEIPSVAAETFTPPNVRVDDSLLDENETGVPALASWGTSTLYMAYAQMFDLGFTSRIMFARSLDSGNTWEGFTNVSDEAMGFGYVTEPDIAVAPNGTIYVVWFEQRFFDSGIYISWSSDGGLTWGDGLMNSNDVQILNATDQVEDPNIGILDNGTIGVAWAAHNSFESHSDINTSFSYDGGITWTTPVRANDDPIGDDQDRPDIAVAGNTFHLVWIDDRNPGPDQIYGASWSGTWSTNVRVDDALSGVDADEVAIVADIDGDLNSLGVVYIDERTGENELYYTNSSDGGLNWGDGVSDNDVQLSNPTVIDNSVERPRIVDFNGILVAAWTDDVFTPAPDFNDTDIATSSSLDGITWTPPSRANDDEIDSYFSQDRATLAILPGKVFIAYQTWHEGTDDIALTWSTDGMIWGDGYTNDNDIIAVGLGTLNGGDQWDPQLVEYAGSLYSVWTDSRDIDYNQIYPYLGNDNIYFSESSDGITWGDGLLNNNDIRVDDGTKFSDAHSPDLGVNPSGRLYVAYTGDKNGDNDTFVTWSDDGGQIWGDGHINGNDIRVNNDTIGNGIQQLNPVIAVAPNGTLYIAWEDERNGNSDIFVGVSGNGGSSWSNYGPVNDDVVSASQRNPAIAVTPSNVYLVWEDDRNGNEDIFSAVSVNGGASWSVNIRVDDDPANGNQTQPALTVADSGVIAVAWVDTRNVSTAPDIFSTESSDGGNTWGDGILNNNDLLVNDMGSGSAIQGGPSVAADNMGFIAFSDDRNGINPDVFFSKFNSSMGSWSSPDDQVNDPLFQSELQDSPEIVIDSMEVSVIWRDARLGFNNIWFAQAPREEAGAPSPLDRIELTPWPGPTNLLVSQIQGYTAWGYNQDGSLNLTWLPSWGTTDGKGTLGNFGGSAASGYTVDYTASIIGLDNITVSDSVFSSITNQSIVSVTDAPSGSPLNRIELTPWPGPTDLLVSQIQTFTALGYNLDESLNLTWSPAWGTTNALGILGNFGGSAGSGFTAEYTANTPGIDNITVTDTILVSITNQSLINITSPPVNDFLDRIELTPGPIRTIATGSSSGFTAIGFSQSGAKNLTWIPTWDADNGIITETGGSANNGYTATYQAPTIPGPDILSVLNGSISNSTDITVVTGPVAIIELTPWPAIQMPVASALTFTALGFDSFGNQNTTWIASWDTTNSLGSITASGGDAASGFTATFTSGTELGTSGITGSDTATPSVSNTTSIDIHPGPLSYIEITPWPSITINLPGTRVFLVGAFDAVGNLNTTWSPNLVIDGDIGTLGASSEPSPGSHQITFIASALGFGNITASDPSTSISNVTMIEVADHNPPQSSINPLSSPSTSLILTLTYTASDTGGSGLKEVEIWYRLNEGTWTLHDTVMPWTDASVSFTATGDGTWDFYSIALDNSSNEEAPPSIYDTRVIIDSAPVTVIDNTPKDEGNKISPEKPITITFSEAMNQSSVEDALTVTVDGEAVPGSWSWSGNNAIFTPTEQFPEGKEVKVNLDGTKAMDLGGDSLGDSEEFIFTIAGEEGKDDEFPSWIILLLLVIIIVIVLLLFFMKGKGKEDETLSKADEKTDEEDTQDIMDSEEPDDSELDESRTNDAKEGRETSTQEPLLEEPDNPLA
jgi:hypothetical protein